MFKYRMKCDSKEKTIYAIQQIINNDFDCGKNLFGGKLFRAGIHFKKCDKTINGFYLEDSENEVSRGGPIRVCFTGEFAEENGNLFFDVYIYPSIQEVLLLILGSILFSVFGKAVGVIISILLLLFFGKCYYKIILDTYDIFNRIIE